MSSEHDLISKILITRDLTEVVDAGITPRFFLDPDNRVKYKTILQHQARYSQVPTVETFLRDYPEWELSKAGEPISYYLNDVTREYKNYLFEIGINESIDLYDEGNSEEAFQRISQIMQDISISGVNTRVTDITKTGERRIERYTAYGKNEDSLRGIPTGFECLDKVTLGWQPKQLITFVGPPAAGKSTMLLLADLAAHTYFYTPLFIGFEMSNEEQEERHDAIRSGVSHSHIRSGKLSKEEFKALKQMMSRTKQLSPMLFSEDANSSLTVSGVAAQIDRHKPSVVFIDGVYMMEDENGESKGSPQALTNITRSLKQLAKNQNLPIIISTQVLLQKMVRQKVVTQASIGYSSSFLQDSDIVIAVENTDDPSMKKLKTLKARSHGMPEAYLHWNWDNIKFEEMEEPDAPKDIPVSF